MKTQPAFRPAVAVQMHPNLSFARRDEAAFLFSNARLESRVATLLGELCGEVGEAAGEASLDSSL